MALSESQKKDVASIGVDVVVNAIRDVWNRSQAKKEGMSFDEFQAARLEGQSALAQYSSSSQSQVPASPGKVIANYISDNIRPITFGAQDAYEAAEKAARQAASDLLRTLGIN